MKKYEPQMVAGTLMAIDRRLYKTTVDDKCFHSMLKTARDSDDAIRLYNDKATIHKWIVLDALIQEQWMLFMVFRKLSSLLPIYLKLCLLIILSIAALLIGCTPPMEEGVSAYTIGDYPEAYKIIKKYAEKGNADAQNYIGKLYSDGHGVEQNMELAAEWFQKAANQGHADAQNNLGIAYSKALGVPKDGVYAMALFRHAAGKDHIDAQNNLGGILITGQGVERNIPEGVRWLKKAAEQNSDRVR